MRVCLAAIIAVELAAANAGVGFMIMAASKFMSTDLVVMGIIIGVTGFNIEIWMRYIVPERKWSFSPISASNKNFNPRNTYNS